MKHKTLFLSLTILTLFLSKTTSSIDPDYESCAPKPCGNQTIRYPFWIQKANCGKPGFNLTCQNDNPVLHTPDNNYTVQQIFYQNQSLRISNSAVLNQSSVCFPQISNFSLELDKFENVSSLGKLFLFPNCSVSRLLNHRFGCGIGNSWGLAVFGNDGNLSYALERCEKVISAPVELYPNDGIGDYLDVLRRGILVKWKALNCSGCEESGGRCGFDSNTSRLMCYCPDRPHLVRCHSRRSNLKVVLGTAIPGSAILLLFLLILTIWCGKKWNVSSYVFSRNTSSDPSSKAELEDGNLYFGVPFFSYFELEEATNNFDTSKELGDGGFGTVYHGKLRDGREVAVKRLYEHNYKRVAQFMNEIEILTRLRHKNLVSLFGCTSRQSRELLLVYEFIPNGTVADHLHGDRAENGPLTWPIRMKIALETADALAYLHASDIVHRDVKTNNILLDNNFCVKVADFGLSRLFPADVTHVSTAPQGTPGYVDPEYYRCYQLTGKSDVYSFGVVLVELISSMPAVDISRDRNEINLSDLAVKKIQNGAFKELIDPSLGFETDSSIERMTTSVAEVAFRCLQLEKEMRPTMDEVLEALKEIQECKDDNNGALAGTRPPKSPEEDEVVLLKNSKGPPTPDSVTERLVSCPTTSIFSS